MIKAIFILEKLTKEKIDQVTELQTNTIFINDQNFLANSNYLNNWKGKIYIEVPVFQGEERWNKYPNSRPVDKNGKPLEKINWYAGVCPNNPQVRRDIHVSINQLIEAYPVDGLWLDFIRYPNHWEEVRSDTITEYCFCAICLEKFKKDGGIKPEGKEWIEWKCSQITKFVTEVKILVHQQRRNIKFGIFAVP